VCYLRSLGCDDIEFTAEDASRSDPDFVCEVVSQVIKAGATTIMIPDTVGWQLSPEYSKLISHIKVRKCALLGAVFRVWGLKDYFRVSGSGVGCGV
jgi:2-isopropylmalate synthase